MPGVRKRPRASGSCRTARSLGGSRPCRLGRPALGSAVDCPNGGAADTGTRAGGAGGLAAMKHSRSLLLGLAFLPLWGVRERSAWAQAPGAPPSPERWSGTVVLAVTMLALFVILGVVARLFDRRRKRQADAIGLQSQLSDTLLMDRTLQSAAVTATVHTPMWKRSPLIVEVRGDVP